MTRNRRSPASAVLTGVTLAVTGALVAGLGYVGRNWAEQQDRNAISKISGERWQATDAVRKTWLGNLKERLAALGSLELNVTDLNAAGPKIEFPDDLVAVISSTVRGATDALVESRPDVDYMVRANLYLMLKGLGGRNPTPSGEWSAMSSGVPSEASTDPASHGLYSIGNQEIQDLAFELPEDHPERGRASEAIHRYFEDRAFYTLDVAGKTVIQGVRGLVTMELFGSEPPAIRTGWSTVARLLQRLSQLGLLFLLLAPPIWVFLDARRKRLPAGLWGLFVLPTSLLGILVYALANREAGPSCPECGERVSPRYAACPYCRTELKGTCPTCGQTVGLNWHYCPSCSTEL